MSLQIVCTRRLWKGCWILLCCIADVQRRRIRTVMRSGWRSQVLFPLSLAVLASILPVPAGGQVGHLVREVLLTIYFVAGGVWILSVAVEKRVAFYILSALCFLMISPLSLG